MKKYSFILFVLVLSAIGFAQSRETRMGVNGSGGSSAGANVVTTDTTQTITGEKTLTSNTQTWQGGFLKTTAGSGIISLNSDTVIDISRGNLHANWNLAGGNQLQLYYGGAGATEGQIAIGATTVNLGGTTVTDAVGFRLNTSGGGSKPTCAVGIRGTLWYVASAGGVADTMEVCAKASTDVYAWRSMATIP